MIDLFRVSLNKVGNVYQSLGQWEDAKKVYQEAVCFTKILSDRFPNTGDYSALHNHVVSQLEKQEMTVKA